jgi:hypothetical protein
VKIKVTYEEADLKQLIRLDLARQGIAATDADITLAKGKAEVSVEVTRADDALVVEPVPVEHAAAPAPVDRGIDRELDARPPPPKEPPLQVVEGGANPVDMSDVLGASNRIARQNPGKFPTPERQLMDGESFDFPGDK